MTRIYRLENSNLKKERCRRWQGLKSRSGRLVAVVCSAKSLGGSDSSTE